MPDDKLGGEPRGVPWLWVMDVITSMWKGLIGLAVTFHIPRRAPPPAPYKPSREDVESCMLGLSESCATGCETTARRGRPVPGCWKP
ncbi:hypothetical protein AB6A40_002440 [Gnathostoma spinigerum]|uniref:Uncharacterized protein n=1 Tax=Gnathostoma spinigerum TaxID=75299 RepID=A0ABD6EEB3_9BILA